MKKHICLIVFLFIFFSPLIAQPSLSENEVRQKIDAAKNVVQQTKQALRNAEQNLKQKSQELIQQKEKWNVVQKQIRIIQQRLESVENSLNASVAHVNEKINFYKQKLERQENSGASQEQIAETKNYIVAYQNMKERRLNRNSLTESKQRLEANIERKEQELRRLKPQLQTAIENLKTAEEQINQANLVLSDAQVKLAEVLTEAPDLLVNINPPHLQNVKIKQGGSLRYEAEWADYSEVIDEQMELIKKGIVEQKSHLNAQKKAIDLLCDELLEQNKTAQAKLDAYVAEVQGWGVTKVIMADLLDAGISIARNFKEMGPYAFAYEAVWRVGLATAWATGVTGANNPQWDVTNLPTSVNPPPDYAGTAASYAKAVGLDQLKGVILDATKVAIGSSGFGKPGTGITFSHNGSYTANLTSWKGIKDLKGNFSKLVREGKFWVVADEDLLGKWVAPVAGQKSNVIKEFYKTLTKNPGRIVQEIKGSFNKQRLNGALLDVAQSAGIQMLKDWADQDRVNLWTEYLIEDNKRTSLQRALQGAGQKRRDNQKILEALGLALQDLVKEKEEQSKNATRFLKIVKNEKLTGNGKFTITLSFSANITVESVTLGGKAITGTENEKIWTGGFDLTDIEDVDMAQLLVKANGKTTRKQLDNPLTTAKYKASTKSWIGYERITDNYHKIKLKALKKGTSIVLLFDCSGSMKDNGRMQRAIKAGQEVLTSAELQPNDEVSLMAFYDCYSIRLIQPFTSNIDEINQKMSSLGPSRGTPLSLAMEQAAIYMESAARTSQRKMIILTDGEESCSGNEYLSMERIKQFNQSIRKAIVK